jgi:hypothetical protein
MLSVLITEDEIFYDFSFCFLNYKTCKLELEESDSREQSDKKLKKDI